MGKRKAKTKDEQMNSGTTQKNAKKLGRQNHGHAADEDLGTQRKGRKKCSRKVPEHKQVSEYFDADSTTQKGVKDVIPSATEGIASKIRCLKARKEALDSAEDCDSDFDLESTQKIRSPAQTEAVRRAKTRSKSTKSKLVDTNDANNLEVDRDEHQTKGRTKKRKLNLGTQTASEPKGKVKKTEDGTKGDIKSKNNREKTSDGGNLIEKKGRVKKVDSQKKSRTSNKGSGTQKCKQTVTEEEAEVMETGSVKTEELPNNTEKTIFPTTNKESSASRDNVLYGNKVKKQTKKKGSASDIPKPIDNSDVTAVLMHMEGLENKPSTSYSSAATSDDDEMMSDDDSDGDATVDKPVIDSDDDSEGDWEEVADHHHQSPKKSQLPDKPIEITLEAPLLHKKKKKKGFDLEAYFRRQVNKFKKEVAADIHKVNLLCLLARTQYLNVFCQDEGLCAQAMSVVMVTRELTLPSLDHCSQATLGKVVNWICRNYPLKEDFLSQRQNHSLENRLELCLHEGCVSNTVELALVFVILLRQIGFLTRLVMSLNPLPLKHSTPTKTKPTDKPRSSAGKSKKQDDKPKKSTAAKSPKNNNAISKDSSDRKKHTGNKSKKETKTKSSGKARGSNRACTKRLSMDAYKDADEEGGEEKENDGEYIPTCDESDTEEGSDRRSKNTMRSGTEGDTTQDDLEDSDFEDNTIMMRTKALVRTAPVSRKNKKALSSDSESSVSTTSKTVSEWVEVYLESEKKWICIDCVSGITSKPNVLEKSAKQPVTYVIGIDNAGAIKDVTPRYARQWLTETRKLRVEQAWWNSTLEPYLCTDRRRDEEEDKDLQGHLMQRPMPTSVSAFKGHPLYCLSRHLLKFEAIYPESAVPLGYMKGEPVYARECVHTLHSRENWLKEGRAVRVEEEAYKFVKSRSKWNKPKDNPEAKDLELFGRWQTEVYIPPPAVDGKVPRNAHGNVEMFLPSMLPAGTVHLKVPALNKVAKKLDIDCAPAMVGWDHHCGFSHPLMDGWIVCEEFKDILLAAWDEEQEIIREKEAEKREKRVLENWKKLTRGLLIKERLKKRFDLVEKPDNSEMTKNNKISEVFSTEEASDTKYSWPQNRLTNQDTHFICKVEEL